MGQPWPTGGGEVGALMRALPWSGTPLGPPSAWPQSLKTVVELTLANPLPTAVLWGREGVQIYNDRYAAMLGAKHPAALGQPARASWPRRWHVLEPIHERVLAGEALTLDDPESILVPQSDGPPPAPMSASLTPVRDENGAVAGIHMTALDLSGSGAVADKAQVEERLRDSEASRRLLLGEMRHRVRGTMAFVRSVIRRTKRGPAIEDGDDDLDGRLSAFERAHAAATRQPTAGVSLEFMIAEELLTLGAHEGDHLTIHGPMVRLQPRAAETFALAIHELAVNALKFGALARPQGHIEVAWEATRAGAGQRLAFTWVETGVRRARAEAPGQAPPRRGFGTEVLERMVREALQAKTVLTFPPSGARYSVELPIDERIVRSVRA